MGDFYQSGLVTTLHNLRHSSIEDLEEELITYSKERPIGLIIPSLFSELKGEALKKIIVEISKVPYLGEVVIGLDAANAEEFDYAKKFFSILPQHHRIIWNDGPRMKDLDNFLKQENIAPNELGKGRNAWYCFGYMIASGRSRVIALHDADILTYERSLLAKLIYPVANPNFPYMFCKGFYFRADEHQLNGRVVRLMIKPLLRSLKKYIGDVEILEYLDSFKYPLAGEFSMTSDVILNIRIPSDWGLEIGILSEIHRNYALRRICQVDIADRYDHKHQDLSPEDKTKGLNKMTYDIAFALFVKLAQEGAVFSSGMIRSIRSTYLRIAFDYVESYQHDALMNGYEYDRHTEERMVSLFSYNILNAGIKFLETPDHPVSIPNWKRVMSAIPDYLDKFYEAVELDNE